MLIGHTRSTETRVLDEGEQMPDGWDFWDDKKRVIYPAELVEEIEAEDMDALLAKVPTGRILLNVRAV